MKNFLDSATVQTRRITDDGYLVGSVRCARTGIQAYTRKELKLDGDPEAIIMVYRPESAVFAEDSLRTYAGKPITVEHPPESVDSKNWRDLAVGTVGSKVVRDGEFVQVDFALMDAAAIKAVQEGTCEISMGYSTPMELVDGMTPDGQAYQAVQTGPIKINHLAVVKTARGGKELRIGDADNWGATPVNHSGKETSMSTKSVVLGDSAVVVPLADAIQIEAFKDSMLKKLADAEAAKDKMAADKDEELGKLKAKNKQLEDAAMTPAKLTKLIADRVALEGQVKALAPATVCDSIPDEDLRRAAVVAVLGDSAVVDASAAEINGMFKALVTSQATKMDDSVRTAISSRPVQDAAVGGWTDAVAAKAGVRFKKGA